MKKRLFIFYIIDIVIVISSLIAMIIINKDKSIGLASLTSVGYFCVCGIVFLFSICTFSVISMLIIINNFRKKNKNGK